MKRALILVVAVAGVMLLVPTMATAKIVTLKGKVKGNSNAKVTVKVKAAENGSPLSVKSFEFKRVDSECGGELNGVVKNIDVDSPLLDAEDGYFVGTTEEGPESDAYQVRGNVHRKSKKITNGEIEFFMTDENGDLETNCGEVKYTATR